MAAGRSRSRRKNEGKRKNLTERKRKNNDEICLVWCLLLAPASRLPRCHDEQAEDPGAAGRLSNGKGKPQEEHWGRNEE